MERGVWTVRPDALFTKYHVELCTTVRGAWLSPLGARRPVCVTSLVASDGYFLEKIEELHRSIKPVGGNLSPYG